MKKINTPSLRGDGNTTHTLEHSHSPGEPEHPVAVSRRVWVVNALHPGADDRNPGTLDQPLRSIGRAASLANPGDRVLVRGGVYRERVAPARGGEEGNPIVYEAAPGERVVIRGSVVWCPEWRELPSAPGVFYGAIASGLVGDFNPYARTLNSYPGRKTLGQVFVDGEPLLEMDRLSDVAALPGTWMAVEDGGALLVHPNPSETPWPAREVELTVRNRIFAPYIRGLGHITVRGFVMEHCANDFPRGFWSSDTPQAGALSTRGGHHWILENNEVRFAKTVGVDCGSEGKQDAEGLGQPQPSDSGHHLIRNNVVSDNGAAGIVGYEARNTRIVGNTLERNNALGFTAPETAALKFHDFTDGWIEGNLIRDNDTCGIWLDNVWHNSRVTRNVLIANQGAGIFIEMGEGPLLVDHNIVAFTRATTALGGDGVYSHDASAVLLAHNLLFFNANFGVWVHLATDRTFETASGTWREVEASGWRIRNNILVGNHRGCISLPPVSVRSRDNRSNGNFVAGPYDLMTLESHAMAMDAPLFLLNTNKGRVPSKKQSAGMLDLESWRLLTGQDENSRHLHLLRPMLSTRSLHLEWIMDERIREIETLPMPELDCDFFGTPLPKARPLPGPFQTMALEPALREEGEFLPHRGPFNRIRGRHVNRFLLWPLRVSSLLPVSTETEVVEDFTRDF